MLEELWSGGEGLEELGMPMLARLENYEIRLELKWEGIDELELKGDRRSLLQCLHVSPDRTMSQLNTLVQHSN